MPISRRLLVAGLTAFAAGPAKSGPATLAPSGVLRAILLPANPAQGRIDPVTGQVTGPAADLTQALARRLGVPFALNGGDVLKAVAAGEADIGFLAYDRERAKAVDFSETYLLVHNTYVVRAGSPFRAPADLDRAGVRIGVSLTDAGGYFLQRSLKAATLKGNPKGSDLAEAQRMFAAGEIDAYAANTQRLTDVFGADPAFRVLPGAFYSVQQAIVVRKGQPEQLAEVNRFLAAARGEGLIAASIAKARLIGVEPAPPGVAR